MKEKFERLERVRRVQSKGLRQRGSGIHSACQETALRTSFRPAFSLIEMLVVIGILAVLIGIGMSTFSSSTKKAEKAKGQELVDNVATALTMIYQEEGCWPRRILAAGASDGELTAEIAYDIAKRGKMPLTLDKQDKNNHSTVGLDRMGIVSPWALATIKAAGTGSVGEGARVRTGGTIKDHRLRFAVDTKGEGFVRANVGGEALTIRASAAVWCAGMDGRLEKYSDGLRKDDIYSWASGQIKK